MVKKLEKNYEKLRLKNYESGDILVVRIKIKLFYINVLNIRF